MRPHVSEISRLALATSLALWSSLALAELPEVTLAIRDHKITAEVASTDATRSTGLMHRRMLPENRGMLFNVWVLIWPNQQKILGLKPATDPEKAKARRVAFLASRTNTMLSIPMVFFMVASGGVFRTAFFAV